MKYSCQMTVTLHFHNLFTQKNLKLLLLRPKGSSACTEIVAVMITHTTIESKAVALVATVAAVEVSVAKLELIVEKTDLKRPRLQLKQSK